MAEKPTDARYYQAMAQPERDLRNANLARLLVGYARGRSLLDVGCGYGLHLAQARRAGFEAHGIEPDPALIALAKQRFGELDIVQDRIESFETQERYDNVLLVDVLELIEDDWGAVAHAAALLAPAGRLILCVPASQRLFGTRDQMLGFLRRYERAETLERLRDLGLRVVAVRRWNAIAVAPYFLVHVLARYRGEVDGLRGGAPRGGVWAALARLGSAWYRHVENRVSFGFGLSLVVVAERPA